MTKREYLWWIVAVTLMIFTGTWTGSWFYDQIELEQEERVKLLYEGDAGWFPVYNIELENDLLKKKLDDLQAHYDSMVCYRPGGN
jgi:hypothetical protein